MLSQAPRSWSQELEGALGWKSFGTVGDIVYAPVQLDGYNLFSIAAERTEEKGGNRGLDTLQMRQNRIENRLESQLRYLLDNNIDPASLQLITTQLNKQIAVQAVIEGKAAKPIVTVTALDAEIYGMSETEVAEDYARQIERALVRAMQERQPAAQRSQLRWAMIIGTITSLVMAFLFGWQKRLRKICWRLRQEFLDRQKELSLQQTAARLDSEASQDISEQQQKLFQLKRQIEQKSWQKNVLVLLLVIIGIVGLAWALQSFPQTRSVGILLVRQPLGLLLISLIIATAIIFSRFLIDWLLTQWVGTEDQISATQIERRRKRVPVLSTAWKDIITALLIVLGGFLFYRLLSLSTGLNLVTQLGVLGVAVSLIFQSSIKDALAGWMLMARDAFTLGDFVKVKEVTGVVEEMGLFMTQIRSSPGELITIRNGEITTVINSTKDWARMDFTVLVDYATDVKQAMALMQEAFQSMKADALWKPQLIGEPDILGIEQFQSDGILLKIRTQTQPGQQYDVTREFRLRLNHLFQQLGIKIAIPQREVRYRKEHAQNG